MTVVTESAAVMGSAAQESVEQPVARAPELAVIVPTYREAANVRPLLALLHSALAGIAYEIIFVDDHSPDGTAALVREIGRTDPRVRQLMRIGRRGLSSAVVEGALSTGADYVAVLDADLQHDETLLPRMLEILKTNRADVVVGSRYTEGGGVGDWSKSRAWMSQFATRLSSLVLPQRVTDPMSGFFMTRRDLFEAAVPHLSGEGYKILLDYLASSPAKLRVAEVPYVFRQRLHGESKLDSLVLWEYAMLLADKLFGHVVPPRFLLFGIVGGTGVLVHFAVLSLLLKGAAVSFEASQTAATLVAMTTNYLFNNWLTYRDKRLHGLQWWKGLASFYIVCSLGAVANVGIASVLFERHYLWWVAGLAGILVGTVFNFAMTSVFTWKRK